MLLYIEKGVIKMSKKIKKMTDLVKEFSGENEKIKQIKETRKAKNIALTKFVAALTIPFIISGSIVGFVTTFTGDDPLVLDEIKDKKGLVVTTQGMSDNMVDVMDYLSATAITGTLTFMLLDKIKNYAATKNNSRDEYESKKRELAELEQGPVLRKSK